MFMMANCGCQRYLKEFHDNMKAFDELNRFGLAESPLIHHINENLLNDTIYGSKMKDPIDLAFAKKLVHHVVILKVSSSFCLSSCVDYLCSIFYFQKEIRYRSVY